MLDLPFAARRMFDEKGNEHFDLQNFKRDQLVFISCGEPWLDPRLTRAEQQRRTLLSQLSSDVGKIKQFCALRNPESKCPIYLFKCNDILFSGHIDVLDKVQQ